MSGIVRNKFIGRNGLASWATVEQAISDIEGLYANNPMWRVYEAQDQCYVNYQLTESNTLELSVTFPSLEAANSYLTNSAIYGVKTPAIEAGYRFDYFILAPDGTTYGGTFNE
jgi:hypothetical protein